MPRACASTEAAMTTCRVAMFLTRTKGALCRSRLFLRNLSIGHWFKYAQRICRTAGLQDDGLANLSSMTVDQLQLPLLHITFPRNRCDEPACGRRIRRAARLHWAKQQSDPPTAFGRQLQ